MEREAGCAHACFAGAETSEVLGGDWAVIEKFEFDAA